MTDRLLCNWKPARGTRVLEKEADDAAYLALERRVKAEVRKRDGRCRWPEKHKCRLGLESAHVIDASLGGPLAPWNLVTLCAFLHRRGPDSIHGKQLRIEHETAPEQEPPLFSFWRQGEDGIYFCIGREVAPFELAHD